MLQWLSTRAAQEVPDRKRAPGAPVTPLLSFFFLAACCCGAERRPKRVASRTAARHRSGGLTGQADHRHGFGTKRGDPRGDRLFAELDLTVRGSQGESFPVAAGPEPS